MFIEARQMMEKDNKNNNNIHICSFAREQKYEIKVQGVPKSKAAIKM
jgi:hypothetical protein